LRQLRILRIAGGDDDRAEPVELLRVVHDPKRDGAQHGHKEREHARLDWK